MVRSRYALVLMGILIVVLIETSFSLAQNPNTDSSNTISQREPAPQLPTTIRVSVPPPPSPPPGYVAPGGSRPVPSSDVIYPSEEDPFLLKPHPGGLFSSFEIGLVEPQINGRLSASVSVTGVPRTVSLPFADLDWTGSPRIELGYRFVGGGSLMAAYRSVVSTGSAELPRFDAFGGAFLRSRIDLNSLDLDYASEEIMIAPFWDIKWKLGARVVGAFYDSRAIGLIKRQRVSNNFVGAGPHFGLDFHRYLDAFPGLALFGRLETAVIFGRAAQSFEEINTLRDGSRVGGATRLRGSETSPMVNVQFGLSYIPPRDDSNWLRFTFGYQFEQWWNVGNHAGGGGDVLFHGLFFRGEFNY